MTQVLLPANIANGEEYFSIEYHLQAVVPYGYYIGGIQ